MPELGLSLSEQAGRLEGWPEHNREEAIRKEGGRQFPGAPVTTCPSLPGRWSHRRALSREAHDLMQLPTGSLWLCVGGQKARRGCYDTGQRTRQQRQDLGIFFFLRFTYFWLHCVFIAAYRLLLVVESTGSRHAGSVVAVLGLQSLGSVAVEYSLSCSMACGIFHELVSSALASGFLTTGQPETPWKYFGGGAARVC